MERRRFLLSLGSAGSLGMLGQRLRRPERHLDVRVWLSERAAAYDAVEARVVGYLERAIDHAHGSVSVTAGDPVSVSTEDAYELMRSTEWPRRVLGGAARRGLRAADDVNLLVTDGDVSRAPSGAGVNHFAAVGGARFVDRVDPAGDRTVVPYSEPARVTQVVLHECGHALGLSHDHGQIDERDGAVAPSPMVSSYAWAPPEVKDEQFDHERCACGEVYPSVEGKGRLLGMTYSECASEAIRAYRGGYLP